MRKKDDQQGNSFRDACVRVCFDVSSTMRKSKRGDKRIFSKTTS